MSRPIRLFTPVFNEPYLNWFYGGLLRSLWWPKNRAALTHAVRWDIWTTKRDANRVRAAASIFGIDLNILDSIPDGVSWADKEPLKAALYEALASEIEQCARDDAAFLWLGPDSIFGDGSISTLMGLGSPPGICVALGPMRVKSENFIDAMGLNPLSNAKLVSLALDHAHQSFTDSLATAPMTNSLHSGVSHRKLDEGLYAVTHRQPSAYLMQPTIADAGWFRGMKKFGSYDHSFPRILVEQQRQRVIGSSDAAFVVELTPATTHVPPLAATDENEPDRFNQNLPHHAANRNVVCIWRAA